jgi:hypothetical protein
VTKLTQTELSSLTNEQSALSALNSNKNAIVTAFDNTLSRDGTLPNQMGASLDMNSNRIINLPTAIGSGEPLTFDQFEDTALGLGNVPLAGTTGQVLRKVSATDYDMAWADEFDELTAGTSITITDTAPTTTIAVTTNGIDNAQLRQGVARSVIGVTGDATANVADIQGSASQLLNVNSAGTALTFTSTPTVATSLTVPAVYGGSAAGSTLLIQSTSNGSPSGDTLTLSSTATTVFATNGVAVLNVGIASACRGEFNIAGNTTGSQKWLPAANASGVITWPAGTVDFSATGGAGKYVKQNSAGSIFTVTTVAASEIASGAALTKTDDTNVTLTLGGSASTALLAASSLTLGWTGQLGLTRGGTAASLTASNGGIVYSTASALAILSGTATANQALLSGSSTTPAWSTATYPATTTINRLLYSSSTNVIGEISFSANAFLGGGASPSWTYTPVIGTSGTTGTLGFSGLTSGTVTVQPQSAAGTYNFNLPITAGSSGQFLTSAAGGSTAMTWDNISSHLTAGSGISLSGTTNVTITASASAANPTGTVGLSVVNGSLSTYLRSDGAPALSQAIAPLWTAKHQWNLNAGTIGTSATGTVLQAVQADSTATLVSIDSIAAVPTLLFRRGNNTLASPSAVAAADEVGRIEFGGFYNGAWNSTYSGFIKYFALNNWTATDDAGYMTFTTTPTGTLSAAEAMRIQASGGVSIGTTTDPGIGLLNILTGIRINNAATTGNVLRGNGTNFVSAQLAHSDLSGTLIVSAGGTGQTTLTNHGVLIGAGTTAITQLAAAAAGTVLTGQGSSADPSFSATPTLGVANTTLGTLAMCGNTSGTITIQPQAAAGTYNFNLPTAAGSSNQLLTSGGGGSTAQTYQNIASLLTSGTGITVSGTTNATIAFSDAQLTSNIPQVSKSTAYTTVLTDGEKHILHPTADNNARTFTIDSNANVAYPIGTAITFVNQINTVTIAITSDTLTLAGNGSTGSRTLAANGIATALKISTTGWIISGTGLT